MTGRVTMVSYAQNGEDIVLWRALGHVRNGHYVDVGANSPEIDSVTKVLYDRGWSGVNVEPLPQFVEQLRDACPRDVTIEAVVSRTDGDVVLHEFPDTGLSTLREEFVTTETIAEYGARRRTVRSIPLQRIVDENLAGEEVHVCKIDVEGAEAEVLASIDLTGWRPWVLVIEATRPNRAEPTHEEWEGSVLAAGYRFCMFDGLSRWYVSEEHADLKPALSYPACSLDDAVPAALRRAEDEVARAHEILHETDQRARRLDEEAASLRVQLVRWRGAVLDRWAEAVEKSEVPAGADLEARAEVEAMRQTLSWRVTTPLRAIRAQQLKVRR